MHHVQLRFREQYTPVGKQSYVWWAELGGVWKLS